MNLLSIALLSSQIMAKVVGGKQLPEDEVALAHWLMKNGPISIGINANSMQVGRIICFCPIVN